ncbi:hypothetical protein KUCAC02_027379 [Chaenocephalus aceratus]|uniref:Uncharacterized protein n=1 Tax=Chaenocephalus aceratus TaxID=36190 RepID=A0ACB9W5C4_CHAAC|nr:hypothetical protein KUCAC02_027379 [Chaenocephalus aceratus]
MEQTEKRAKERADTVDLTSSFSTTSSFCSTSSSPSSLESSPISTSSLQTSSLSGAHPPSMTPEADTESVRRGYPPSIPECHEQGKMEVDHPAAMHPASEDKKKNKNPDVHQEIEQRWHQVETTPLREEKQVAINTASGNSSNSDRLPADELAVLLDKELGEKQQELDRLQKQNNVFKRAPGGCTWEGTQCQTGLCAAECNIPFLFTAKSADLAQQQIRTLKRSYTEAQDAVDHHESGIQALQTKLASAMAEIWASEQAVARMRNELKLEQNRSKEQEDEYGRGEATLRAQLKDSEDRLREVEASLLERNQALRHLERQQALQRGPC